MARLAQLIVAMAALNPLLGLDLAICDRVEGLTETEFRKELTRIAARSGIEARFRACTGVGVVRLHFTEAGSESEPEALGAAVRRHGQIGPDLRIYVGPI